MRYYVENIEDQLIATLVAQSGLTSGVQIKTHQGEIDKQMFFDPAYMQGMVRTLPFVYVEYAGRQTMPYDSDETYTDNIHTLRFRFFVGAQSLRSQQEGSRSAYAMLRAVYDAIHSKLPYYQTGQTGCLSGTKITVTGFNACSPFYASTSVDELLLINLPSIVIYATEYNVRLLA